MTDVGDTAMWSQVKRIILLLLMETVKGEADAITLQYEGQPVQEIDWADGATLSNNVGEHNLRVEPIEDQSGQTGSAIDTKDSYPSIDTAETIVVTTITEPNMDSKMQLFHSLQPVTENVNLTAHIDTDDIFIPFNPAEDDYGLHSMENSNDMSTKSAVIEMNGIITVRPKQYTSNVPPTTLTHPQVGVNLDEYSNTPSLLKERDNLNQQIIAFDFEDAVASLENIVFDDPQDNDFNHEDTEYSFETKSLDNSSAHSIAHIHKQHNIVPSLSLMDADQDNSSASTNETRGDEISLSEYLRYIYSVPTAEILPIIDLNDTAPIHTVTNSTNSTLPDIDFLHPTYIIPTIGELYSAENDSLTNSSLPNSFLYPLGHYVDLHTLPDNQDEEPRNDLLASPSALAIKWEDIPDENSINDNVAPNKFAEYAAAYAAALQHHNSQTEISHEYHKPLYEFVYNQDTAAQNGVANHREKGRDARPNKAYYDSSLLRKSERKKGPSGRLEQEFSDSFDDESNSEGEKYETPSETSIYPLNALPIRRRYPEVPPYYSFGYLVDDALRGNFFGHGETKDPLATQGEYFVLLPDGRLQTVTYLANQTGYFPRIAYTDALGLPGLRPQLEDLYISDFRNRPRHLANRLPIVPPFQGGPIIPGGIPLHPTGLPLSSPLPLLSTRVPAGIPGYTEEPQNVSDYLFRHWFDTLRPNKADRRPGDKHLPIDAPGHEPQYHGKRPHPSLPLKKTGNGHQGFSLTTTPIPLIPRLPFINIPGSTPTTPIPFTPRPPFINPPGSTPTTPIPFTPRPPFIIPPGLAPSTPIPFTPRPPFIIPPGSTPIPITPTTPFGVLPGPSPIPPHLPVPPLSVHGTTPPPPLTLHSLLSKNNKHTTTFHPPRLTPPKSPTRPHSRPTVPSTPFPTSPPFLGHPHPTTLHPQPPTIPVLHDHQHPTTLLPPTITDHPILNHLHSTTLPSALPPFQNNPLTTTLPPPLPFIGPGVSAVPKSKPPTPHQLLQPGNLGGLPIQILPGPFPNSPSIQIRPKSVPRPLQRHPLHPIDQPVLIPDILNNVQPPKSSSFVYFKTTAKPTPGPLISAAPNIPPPPQVALGNSLPKPLPLPRPPKLSPPLPLALPPRPAPNPLAASLLLRRLQGQPILPFPRFHALPRISPHPRRLQALPPGPRIILDNHHHLDDDNEHNHHHPVNSPVLPHRLPNAPAFNLPIGLQHPLLIPSQLRHRPLNVNLKDSQDVSDDKASMSAYLDAEQMILKNPRFHFFDPFEQQNRALALRHPSGFPLPHIMLPHNVNRLRPSFAAPLSLSLLANARRVNGRTAAITNKSADDDTEYDGEKGRSRLDVLEELAEYDEAAKDYL